LSALPFSGYLPQANPFGAYSQPQGLQSLQMAIQQLVQIVPVQLHQIQQLIQLVAQQQLHQTPQMHALQPFPIPYVGGPTGWLAAAQTGQPQAFTGQAGYVM
jgi:hypothetical protein